MISQEFKSLRKSTGLTMKQIAEQCHTPYRTWQDWENGKRRIPGIAIEWLNSIANIAYIDVVKPFAWNGIVTVHRVVFDREDLEKILAETWHMYGRYVAASIINPDHPNKNRRQVQMHRWLLNAPKGMAVHHKNLNPLDNRKSNLQIMTPSEHSKLHQALARQAKMQEGRKKGEGKG